MVIEGKAYVAFVSQYLYFVLKEAEKHQLSSTITHQAAGDILPINMNMAADTNPDLDRDVNPPISLVAGNSVPLASSTAGGATGHSDVMTRTDQNLENQSGAGKEASHVCNCDISMISAGLHKFEKQIVSLRNELVSKFEEMSEKVDNLKVEQPTDWNTIVEGDPPPSGDIHARL